MGKSAKAYGNSLIKNPLQNIATGGLYAGYKAGKASGLDPFKGAQKMKGFDVAQSVEEANAQAIARQAAIASGQQPGYASMAMHNFQDQNARAALAIAASQRGSSNPALAFRQAQIGSQQANLEGSQQAALMDQQQRMQADQFIAQQYANARGLAFNQQVSNNAAETAYQNRNLGIISGIGTTMATGGLSGGGGSSAALPPQGIASSGGINSPVYANSANSGQYKFSEGGIVPGKAPEVGDSRDNDIVSAKLSPGEVVVPRTVVSGGDKAIKLFLDKIKIEEKLKKLEKK